MTQYPNYGNAYYAAQANPRPTSVTVVAIVGIVWAVLMLLCNGFGLIPLFVPNFGGPNPAMDEIRANRVANAWTTVGPIFGLALSVLLIGGSIGALKLQGWGRAALLIFALLETVAAVVNAAITIAVINPIMAKMFQGQIPGNNAGIFTAAQQGGAVLGTVIAVVLPVWILLVMFRANVKAAFATGGARVDSGAGGYGGYAAPGGAYAPPQSPPMGVPPQYPAAQYPPGQYPPQGPYGQQ